MKPVESMSFEEWQNRNGPFGARTHKDLMRDPKPGWAIQGKMRKAVAYYLYCQSSEVPDEEGVLLSAAALLLLKKPVDPALMAVARKGKSDDEPLHAGDYGRDPDLFDLWQYYHRVELDAAERLKG
jgi:hypothetical protein